MADETFPPPGPTMAPETIASYLYWQYSDDDDLQAFVAAYNELAQGYHDWFLTADLPNYMSPAVSGLMLDWVGAGLYGLSRPHVGIGTGTSADQHGPLNTQTMNELPLNEATIFGPGQGGGPVDDSLYRKVLEWHFYKGDGKHFNVRWLKRRIKRFLTSADETDQTYDISVTFGPLNDVYINFIQTRRFPIAGALLNDMPLNEFVLNDLITDSVSFLVSPLVPVFKQFVEAGILELPFQYDWHVTIN